MAMDERRQTFRVTRVLNGYEVWFRGVHSDVGGGNGNVGLSSVALCWMLRKAQAAGLPIKDAAITSLDARIDQMRYCALQRTSSPMNFANFSHATVSITASKSGLSTIILPENPRVRPSRTRRSLFASEISRKERQNR